MAKWLALLTSVQEVLSLSPTRVNSADDCMAFHYTELIIITPSSSQYDLNTVERDVQFQMKF